MNQPTMTNEQFALWIAAQTQRNFTLGHAEDLLKWLDSKSKPTALKPTEPITPKKK